MKELDGKIVGGCYLRAELDDNGEDCFTKTLLRLCIRKIEVYMKIVAVYELASYPRHTRPVLCTYMYDQLRLSHMNWSCTIELIITTNHSTIRGEDLLINMLSIFVS